MKLETSLGYGASRALNSIMAMGKKPPKALDGISTRESFVCIDLTGKDLEGALETVATATTYLKEFEADMGEAVTVEEKKARQGTRDLLTNFGSLPRMVRSTYKKAEGSDEEQESHSTIETESSTTVTSKQNDETENDNEESNETFDLTSEVETDTNSGD